MAPFRRDPADRLKYKGAFCNSRVRQAQSPSPDLPVIVDEVEVERARSPAEGATPACLMFDGVKALHQSFGREVRFYQGRRIDERSLIETPKGRSDHERRDGSDVAARAIKLAERMHKRVAWAAPGSAEIAAERDEDHVWA